MKKKPLWKILIKARMDTGRNPEYPDPVPVGSMADWDGENHYWGSRQPPLYEEREPFEFVDILTVEGHFRGRSAAGIELRGSQGEHYVIRIKAMVDMLKVATVKGGKIGGRWGFVKQGANFSLVYLGEK